MPNRLELDRLYHDRRQAVRDRLSADSRFSSTSIEGLLIGWEHEAERRRIDPDDPSFWDAGLEWIIGEHEPRGQG
jgi:hypothetical protein